MAKKANFIDIELNFEPNKKFIKPRFIIGKKYYLYAHTRADKSEPFYFGIGTMDRNKNYYRALCHKKRNIIWKRIVNKINNYTILIIDESDNKQEILDKEINYIKLMGKKKDKSGCLANLTDGGEGLKGHSIFWTKEMRKRQSEILKNRKIKESTRDKLRKNIYNSNLIGRKGKNSYVAKSIYKIDILTGNIICEYDTIKQASEHMKVKPQSISSALKKKTKSCGFKWEYKNGYKKEGIIN